LLPTGRLFYPFRRLAIFDDMPVCADDLTSVDLALLPNPLTSASLATGSSSASLFSFILQDQSYGLNLVDPTSLRRVLRPIDSKDVVRDNEDEARGDGESGNWTGGCVESQEGDDEIIVHVRFSELVRIKSVLVGTGGGRGETCPRKIKVWVNRRNGVGFDDTGVAAEQEWELLEADEGRQGSVEYPVKIAKFGNVSDVTLFFYDTLSSVQSRLYYIGFKGETKALKAEPGQALTVGAEQAADSMVGGVREVKRGGWNAVR